MFYKLASYFSIIKHSKQATVTVKSLMSLFSSFHVLKFDVSHCLQSLTVITDPCKSGNPKRSMAQGVFYHGQLYLLLLLSLSLSLSCFLCVSAPLHSLKSLPLCAAVETAAASQQPVIRSPLRWWPRDDHFDFCCCSCFPQVSRIPELLSFYVLPPVSLLASFHFPLFISSRNCSFFFPYIHK